ncbi:MAG: carboxypeptidase-like regulatory domain-containing protein, partial [Bacteroidota bacterium]
MRWFSVFVVTVCVAWLASPSVSAQVWGEVTGRITDAATGESIPGANVVIAGTNFGSNTGTDGRYRFRIPEGTYGLRVSYIGFETVVDTVVVRRGRSTTFDAVLRESVIQGEEVVATAQIERQVGISRIDPRTARSLPTPLGNDPLRAAKSELGVTSNNELSNAYSVRGGSYNENQFFIDGFEIYRPLRTRQGEQEGLGLVNGDLTSRMTLFAGGFPVRYGGKLASVLDATYARPQGTWGGTTYGSTLDGGGMIQGGLTPDIGLAVAARSARPQRFFAGQELQGAYDPDFRDVQGVADVRLGAGHSVRAVGLYARHRFRLAPSQRETTFGIFPNLVRTVAIDFEGVEESGYEVAFGGLLFANTINDKVRAEHRLSLFQTDEFEGYEVTSRTSLYRRVQRPDGPPSDLDRLLEGTTLQRDSADNRIDQTTFTAQGRYLGQFGRHGAEVGWTVRGLRFDDRLFEQTIVTGQDAETREPVDVESERLEDMTEFST